MSSAVTRTPLVRHGAGAAGEVSDWVVVEEPLEIRIAGEPLVVTMRTPGHDHELAAGLLLSEGLIASRADLGTMSHCGRVDSEEYGNVLDVVGAPGVVLEVPESGGRRLPMTASCGICGRQTREPTSMSDWLITPAPDFGGSRAASSHNKRCPAALSGSSS